MAAGAPMAARVLARSAAMAWSEPRLNVDTATARAAAQAGGALLTRTVTVTGSGAGLSKALSPWRKPLAVHDPGKVICDLAVALGWGGGCLADIAIPAPPEVH